MGRGRAWGAMGKVLLNPATFPPSLLLRSGVTFHVVTEVTIRRCPQLLLPLSLNITSH